MANDGDDSGATHIAGDCTTASPPKLPLEFDLDTEESTLEIRHAGGDMFTAGQVFITGNTLNRERYR